ncbi:AZA-guanine resistant1 [Actinidia rufa]|uniref:AZA-guanine resistant1 n=1 Tax=Actinidia rufa TaxID=165716 RepID=A0A7J0EBR5_9ERIC|nr:AZA-guanine resistant1 [Actinidia rufa]
MAYILAVNASILVNSGVTYSFTNCTRPGESYKYPLIDSGYADCLLTTQKDLIVATIASSLIGCLIVGIFANLPLTLAPEMGTNAYFAYTVVAYHGSGSIPYKTFSAAILIEGLVFLVISAFELRANLAQLVPKLVRVSSSTEIGLFMAFSGLQNNQGVGFYIGYNSSTKVTLGACPRSSRAVSATIVLGANGTIDLMPKGMVPNDFLCLNNKMEIPTFG